MEEPGDGKKDLDVCSEEFDALKALTDSVDIPLPVPEAPAYDNLSQFISVIRSRGQPKQPQDEVRLVLNSEFCRHLKTFLAAAYVQSLTIIFSLRHVAGLWKGQHQFGFVFHHLFKFGYFLRLDLAVVPPLLVEVHQNPSREGFSLIKVITRDVLIIHE